MTMKASDFPNDLGVIVLTGGRELRFDVEVFSHLTHLESVAVQGVPKVYVMEHSFANMSSRVPVSFEFSDAHFLTIEGKEEKLAFMLPSNRKSSSRIQFFWNPNNQTDFRILPEPKKLAKKNLYFNLIRF